MVRDMIPQAGETKTMSSVLQSDGSGEQSNQAVKGQGGADLVSRGSFVLLLGGPSSAPTSLQWGIVVFCAIAFPEAPFHPAMASSAKSIEVHSPSARKTAMVMPQEFENLSELKSIVASLTGHSVDSFRDGQGRMLTAAAVKTQRTVFALAPEEEMPPTTTTAAATASQAYWVGAILVAVLVVLAAVFLQLSSANIVTTISTTATTTAAATTTPATSTTTATATTTTTTSSATTTEATAAAAATPTTTTTTTQPSSTSLYADVLLIERGRHLNPPSSSLSQHVLHAAAARLGLRTLSSDATNAAIIPGNHQQQQQIISWHILWCLTIRCTHVDARTFDIHALTSGQAFNHAPGVRELAQPQTLANVSKGLLSRFRVTPETHVVNLTTSHVSSSQSFARSFDAHEPGTRASKPTTWIFKPLSSQPQEETGRKQTVILKNNQPHLLPSSGAWIAQRYIVNTFLINRRKFTLKLFVLVASVRPLRVYVHRRGLAIFADAEYTNLKGDVPVDLAAHVPSVKSREGSDPTEVWTLDEVMSKLDDESSAALERRIHDAIGTVFSRHFLASNFTAHARKKIASGALAPQRRRARLFQLVTADVVVDSAMRPWIVSLDETTNLQAETSFLYKSKQTVLEDLLSLLGANQRVSKLAGKKGADAAVRVRNLLSERVGGLDADYAELLLREAEEEQVVKGGWEMCACGGNDGSAEDQLLAAWAKIMPGK